MTQVKDITNWVWNKLEGDRMIWLIVLFLSLFSLLAVYSSTGTLAYKYKAGNTEYYVLKHFMLMLFGFWVMFMAHRVDHRYYSKVAQLLLWVSIPLLFYTLFFGTELNDARRWVTLPIINLSFQTSDLAKLALIMFLARMLSKKQAQIKDFKEAFLPIIAPVFIVCALIAPADLSSAVVLFGTSLLLMFLGRVNFKYIMGLVGVAVIAGSLFVSALLLLPEETLTTTNAEGKIEGRGRLLTWRNRIEAFWESDTENVSYQVMQAKIAIAKGGVLGQGPGKSTQRNFLPHPYSDFIYAIILEEYGLWGGFIILFLYLAFLYRVIKIVAKSPGAFGALLAVGLAISLVLQAMINMAVAVNLVPVTGLTLPFVSMGGTSMLFTSVAVGIILAVSRNADQLSKKEAELATA